MGESTSGARAVAAPAVADAAAGAIEVEWQLGARNLARVQRWLGGADLPRGFAVAPLGRMVYADAYLETENWSFHRAGVAVRLRRHRGVVEATIKTLAPAVEGVARRREIVETLGVDPPIAIGDAPGPVGVRVRAVAGGHPLQTLFVVRTSRRRFALRRDGVVVGEVTLDASAVARASNGVPARFCRVEIEMRDVPTEDAAPFVAALADACDLVPAASKYEAGLAACGLVPADVPDLGPTAIDAKASVGEVAFAVLRRQLAAFLRCEPGTRLGDDPEALHDMRVAARRLRAALGLFEPWLPRRTRALRLELDWAYGALGTLRDLDVQRLRLGDEARAFPEEQAAFAVLERIVDAERAAARTALLHVLDTRRYARLVARFVAFVEHGPLARGVAARTPVVVTAPHLVRKRFRRLARLADRLGPTSSVEEHHAVRIRVRRLRYALECHADVYGKPLVRMLDALVALQDVLGEHQDDVVMEARLRALCQEPGVDPAIAFAVGRVAERAVERAAALRRRVPAAWRRVRGKRWRRLEHALRR